MSTTWLKIASGSTDGGDLYAESGPGTAFAAGDTLWISCIYKADRVVGTNSLTFRLSVVWLNSAGATISTSSNDVVITGTVGETFLKFAVVAPANSAAAKVKYTAIPGGGTMEHDLYFRSCRLTAFEPGATEGADWDSNVDNIPANLASLVGTEAIENQAILDSIANDNVLSVAEKLDALPKLYADLEARYTDLFNRATTLGLSTTALTTARADWKALLASYSPAWNDDSADTDIYDHFFSDENFPTGWEVDNVSTAANGAYTTVTDASAAVAGRLNRNGAQTGANQYSAALVVKKDAVGKATRNPSFWLRTLGGTTKLAQLLFDTSTGEIVHSGSALVAYGIFDLGDDWLVWGTIATVSGNTTMRLEIYPAHSTNLSATLAAALTGSINCRPPLIVLGDWKKLGRAMLTGRLAAYSAQLTALAKAISERDGSTSVVIDPFGDVLIYATAAGVVKSGELPRNVALTASIGTSAVTTLGTWARTVTPGVTCTIASATGLLNITALDVNEVSVPISFVYAGVTRTSNVHIVRVDDQSTDSGGGGGGGSGTIANTTTIGNTTGTSYDLTNAVSAVMTAEAGAAGKVQCSVPLGYKRVTSDDDGETKAWGKWQWRVPAGTWADIGTETGASTNARTVTANGANWPGSLSVTETKTGLTPGSPYEFRFAWRRTNISGSASEVYRSSGTFAADGTVP